VESVRRAPQASGGAAPRACSVVAVHVVIMGCGRVGSALAKELEALGHSVAVIDRDAGAFRRLAADFAGLKVTGVGFDRDTLVEAGIERAHAFAAVSSGDNSNIIAARVARETFGLDNVVARIYDARRAAVYQKLGIPTVATVRWTSDQVIRRLLPEGEATEWRDPSGQIVLAELAYSPAWVGQRITRLERETGTRVALLTRLGDGFLPHADSLLQEGDLLHVTLAAERMDEVVAVLAAAPQAGDS
jgi:trk system potassium uptake protein TrkA